MSDRRRSAIGASLFKEEIRTNVLRKIHSQHRQKGRMTVPCLPRACSEGIVLPRDRPMHYGIDQRSFQNLADSISSLTDRPDLRAFDVRLLVICKP